MTFTEVFGGTTIYPSGVSYRAVALSANQTLAWPVETATNANIVAQIMDVTPSIASLSILMPPANEASVGETTLFFNAGSFAFTVKDNGGNTIVSIAPGLSYQVYLIGNSTVNGTWRSTQYAAGTSSATAGSLVGAGIKAINTTLNQSMTVTSLNTNYTIGDADRSEAFLWSGGAGTLTLPSAVTVGNDWFCHVRNGGTGAISLATTGGQLINGASSLAFNPGDSAIVICDGSGFFTIGFGQSASFAFDYVSIDLTGQASPYTLAGANLNRIAYSFGGTLTGAMTIHIPATFQQYWLANETIGGFAITVKVAGQTGVIIGNGVRAICYCNGTDLVDADTSSFSFPVSIAQGGTGAVNESGARVNLGGTSTGIAVFTAPSAASARSTLSAAASGANSDITSLSGLTTPLSVGQGGTGTATAFTSGSVVFSGASGVYSQDNANFFWDDANNRLGIGTTTPGGKLEVSNGASECLVRIRGGTSGSSTPQLQFYGNSSDHNWTLIGNHAAALTFNKGTFGAVGSELMRLDINGNVGIGTITPSYKLEARTDAASAFNYIGSVNTTATGAFGAGFLATTGAGSSYFYMRGDGLAYLENATANPLAFATNGSERMRINGSGAVGIGTDSPDAVLHVSFSPPTTIPVLGSGAGALALGPADNYGMLLGTNSSGTGYIQQQRFDGTNTVYPIALQPNGGFVGIGTTAPNAKLELVNNGTNLRLNTTFAGGNFVDINPYVEGISNSGFSINVGGNIRQIIDASGNVGFATPPSAWVSSWKAIDVERGGALFSTLALSGIANNAYFDSGSNWRYKTSYGAATVSMASDGGIAINNATAGTAGNVITFSTRIYVAPAGNVIIGGTTDYPVASDRTLTVAGSSFASLNLVCGGAFSGAGLTVDSAGVLQIRNGGTERARVDSSGNFGIGGTTTPGIRLDVNGTVRATSLIVTTATATVDGISIGYRSIPRSTTTTTAVVGDVGKCIAVTAGITIPNATFAAGDAVSIYNDSGSAVTITQGASLTLRQAGTANTGNRTLAARGMATIWFNSASEAIISGAGVT